MNEVLVRVEKCREDIELPTYAKEGDAGMDIRAAEDVTIYPNETKIIPTGLKFAIPKGYEIQVRPRSGLSYNTPLRITNSPGTIDSGYRDEVGIIIENTSQICCDSSLLGCTLNTKNNTPGIYHIKKGDRVAQIVLKEVPVMILHEVEDVKSLGFNRESGFGGTGVK